MYWKEIVWISLRTFLFCILDFFYFGERKEMAKRKWRHTDRRGKELKHTTEQMKQKQKKNMKNVKKKKNGKGNKKVEIRITIGLRIPRNTRIQEIGIRRTSLLSVPTLYAFPFNLLPLPPSFSPSLPLSLHSAGKLLFAAAPIKQTNKPQKPPFGAKKKPKNRQPKKKNKIQKIRTNARWMEKLAEEHAPKKK